ncbi:MAG: ABC transporter ATP-binding protein/permease [Oscillospiraceae bacterium]|nr:ABC transporter ATP-binding protein/permease [Oscillospiraceae bacterium]
MLELKEIVKDYETGGESVHALRGINIKFRDSEFVSILGPSGCGKTTTLNIIGGLDRFTDGDLIINGRSTKDYTDREWDTYRNHSIGFVFQNYNLIPHQTVLSNVELALTLSGVPKAERRQRAKEALEKVGLGDQLNKKPSQMSGGQMQRVAIARALVNDPDILLADEPTGALDTETSVQIMEILKEISKDKLIIMVTHNPELAERYSTRIIRFIDGKMTGDTNPFDGEYVPEEKSAESMNKTKKTTMSFGTALSLSTNNLMTKKGRTLLTAFAGSIGIIGIALILSISNGIQLYINRVQEDTLSSYPLTIQEETADMSTMMESMSDKHEGEMNHPLDKIYSFNIMNSLMNTMSEKIQTNNLADFKAYLEDESNGLGEYISAVQYTYNVPLNIYKRDTSDGTVQVNPSKIFQTVATGYEAIGVTDQALMTQMGNMSGMNVWSEMLDNDTLLKSQYDVVAGEWADEYNEVMLVVNSRNEITDYALYSLGILDQEEIADIMTNITSGGTIEEKEQTSYTYDEILSLSFSLVLPTDYYKYDEEKETWEDMSEDEDFMKELVENAPEIKVAGIIRPNEEAVATAISGAVGYTHELSEYVVNAINDSDIVKQQKENPDVDVFTGIEFSDGEEEQEAAEYTMDDIMAYVATLPEEQQAQMQMYSGMMTEEQMIEMFSEFMTPPTTDATYDGNMDKLSVTSLDTPASISIYAASFADKDNITAAIDEYNSRAESEGREEDVINFTDYVGLIMSSVTTIINAISYVLIAFVSISLIVSSIMIGIITYISVLERTKEIGILRSIGASKKDISRVFNAETLLVGFSAGALGIIVTLLLNIPINIIIKNLTDISDIAHLPAAAGVILVLISMLLTVIAGVIPSRIAAKKDPVIALRSE